MSLYILKRLLILIPTLLGVMTLSFIITQFVPGGPVDHILATIDSENGRGGNGDGIATGSTFNYSARNGITPKQIDQLTNLYGFDKPLHERFFSTIKNLLTFNLGESYYQHQSIGNMDFLTHLSRLCSTGYSKSD
jgi:microcin C transport system permease protein